jgi:NitT/TauT family transport system permease protein
MYMSVKTTFRERPALENDYVEPVERPARSPVSPRAQATQAVMQRVLLLVPPLLLALFLLAAWLLAYRHVNSLLLPAPGDVFSSLTTGLGSGLFLSNALVTIEESLLGFALALVISLPLGYGIAKWRLFAATVQPYLAAGQAIPAIVIYPLLSLWFGYSGGARSQGMRLPVTTKQLSILEPAARI